MVQMQLCYLVNLQQGITQLKLFVQWLTSVFVQNKKIRVRDKFKLKAFDETDVAEAIGRSVAHTAKNLKVKTIVAATESGHTPKNDF